jgi:hypothetical protein
MIICMVDPWVSVTILLCIFGVTALSVLSYNHMPALEDIEVKSIITIAEFTQ